MLLICYDKCTTCQKAKQWLDSNGITYTVRPIREENPCYEELAVWSEQSGLPLRQFFNTSGLLYKSMGLKDRLPSLTQEEQLRLLASDGMLVRRPILITGEKVFVGFREKEWACLLEQQKE